MRQGIEHAPHQFHRDTPFPRTKNNKTATRHGGHGQTFSYSNRYDSGSMIRRHVATLAAQRGAVPALATQADVYHCRTWYNSYMIEEPTLRLYAVAVAALRTSDKETAIGVQSAIALLPEGITIEEAGLDAARSFFPEADGWSGHHVNATEITQGLPIEPYRITWRAEKVSSDVDRH
jgi:hypothetical protein